MLVLSATMVAGTLDMGIWDGFTPGPAFFPSLIAVFASTLAVLLLIRAWRSRDDEEGVDWPSAPILRRVGTVFGALVAFLLVTPVLGMLPAVAALLAFVMIVALRQPILPSLAAMAITTGFVYVIFVRWLALPMPTGVLGF